MDPIKVLDKEYFSFEALNDLVEDIQSCEFLEDVAEPEYQGTLRVVITYEEPRNI